MSNETRDRDWKELADYLRRLDQEFYWKMTNLLPKKPRYQPVPPRPTRRAGISMVLRHEQTPPATSREDGPASSDSVQE